MFVESVNVVKPVTVGDQCPDRSEPEIIVIVRPYEGGRGSYRLSLTAAQADELMTALDAAITEAVK